MPRDDREQNFEKALARSLRSPDSARGDDAQANDCLDAETLAAYHERLLDPEEMAQRKAHIASCERCQEILAQLEATDAIPVEADRDLLLDQIVLDLPEPEAPPAGAPPEVGVAEPQPQEAAHTSPPPDPEIVHEPDLVAAAAAAAPSTPPVDVARQHTLIPSAANAAPSSATITFHTPRQDRPKMVRFIALAGAVAAGLIFWLVYRDHNQPIDVAQNRPASKTELPMQSPAPAPPSDNKDTAAAPQTSEPNATAPQNSRAPAAAPFQTPSKPAPAQPPSETDAVSNSLADAKKTIDSAKALQQKGRSNAADAAVGRSGKPAHDDVAAANLYAASAIPQKSESGARKLDAANQSPIAVPPGGAKAAGDSATNLPSGIPATPPPARTKMNPSVVTESVAVDSAAPAVAQLSASAPSETLSMPISGRVLATLTPLSVPAPSGTTLWRIGQAGMIQRSTDSGATWSIQPSGVVTDLIAGSAYSDQICWLVGRNGTILRTTNGGATWQKLTSPSNVDLLSIFAINADSATITDAASRTFETTSGGAHWTRTKLQP
ncbi:MAG TPA: hypothetical protein VMP12_10545 [Candidatus Sulfotelmatobacter sp.]|nr:hypothetical protein [Candidatus Sulfotelmatobacter sp.]